MNVVEIVFSPTGGTERAADIIAKTWSENAVKIDLSNPKADFAKCEIKKEDMVLIAMPSFGGRAPAMAISRLRQIAGKAQSVPLCAYTETGLMRIPLQRWRMPQMKAVSELLRQLPPVAEHSIISKYAAGRPDSSDEVQLADFARRILPKDGKAASIPGSRPCKKSGRRWSGSKSG